MPGAKDRPLDGACNMDLQSIINAEYGIRTGLALARLMPLSAGYALARFLAKRVAGQKNQPMVQAVRTNQWVARGENLTCSELDQAVQETFEDRAYSIFKLYHNLQKPERMLDAVEFGANFSELIEESKRRDAGLVVVMAHISNYELVALAAALRGGQGIALTLPEQPGGYKQHDLIRQRYGIEAIPASMASFKYAVEALREGRVVATGVDRPLALSRHRPTFFGRKAGLPVHYVSLALKARVPLVFAWAYRRADGRYGVSNSEFISMKEYDDRKTTILANTERVLEYCEQAIARDPKQWAMFFPVWPDVSPTPIGE